MLIRGDACRIPLRDGCMDACVTDPPYGIGFMGKEWDSFLPSTAAKKAGLRQYGRLPRWKESNPNLKGRTVNGAISASQIEYDRTLEGQRAFQEWTEKWAREVYRVLKPGAHIVVCGAPRSFHRMTCGLEDAGFEIRDCLSWLYASGFPKSLNMGCRCSNGRPSVFSVPSNFQGVSENTQASQTADVFTAMQRDEPLSANTSGGEVSDTQGHDTASGRSQGFGELRMEGWRDVQAEQGQLHRSEVRSVPAGVSSDGADGRVRDGASASGGEAAGPVPPPNGSRSPSGPPHQEQSRREPRTVRQQRGAQARGSVCEECGGLIGYEGVGTALKPSWDPCVLGRKPFRGSVTANVQRWGTGALNIDACRLGENGGTSGCDAGPTNGIYGDGLNGSFGVPVPGLGRWPANVLLDEPTAVMLDQQTGELVSGASRFYYVAKPSREERDYGCHAMPLRSAGACTDRVDGSAGLASPRAGAGSTSGGRNYHPTVKPVELMRWLVRLVTPPGGTVLDPFLGSGTTGMACRYEFRAFIGLEREAEYVAIAKRRIVAVAPLFAKECTAQQGLRFSG